VTDRRQPTKAALLLKRGMDRKVQSSRAMKLSRLALLATLLSSLACERELSEPPQREMTPERHDPFFPIAEGSFHSVEDGDANGEGGPLDCASCHQPGSESFSDFTCTDCHAHEQVDMDATHVGFKDYLFESPRCYTCHPRGNVAEEIDHEQFFPIRDGTAHEGVSCATCHTDPNDRERVSCTGCHVSEDGEDEIEHGVVEMAEVHNDIPDYEWASPACVTCHPGAEPVGLMDHPFFPITPDDVHGGPKVEGGDELITCSDCHASRADRSLLLCAECHEVAETAEDHDGVPDFLHESGSCLLCHKDGQPEGLIEHQDFFPIGENDTHGGQAQPAISCSDCHIDPTTRTTLGCTACHELNDAVPAPKPHSEALLAQTHDGIPGYNWDSPDCLFCHPDGSPEGAIDHSIYFPIGVGTAHEAEGCTDCHTNPDDRLQVGCTDCHAHEQPDMAVVHSGISEYLYETPSCLACHPNGEPIGAIDHDPFFPVAPPSVHEEISCRECHVAPEDRSVLGCTSCHEHSAQPMNDIHVGMPDYTWDSPACVTCHPRANNPGALDHTAFFPVEIGTVHEAIQCAECHLQQTDRAVLGCAECHEQGPTDADHVGIEEYRFESSSCFMCHPNAEPVGIIQHAFFPIDPGTTHEPFSCRDCHTNPTTRADVGCTTCHQGDHDEQPMGDVHANVPGYTWDSPSCLTCHPNGEPVGFVDHAPLFPIAAGDAHEPVTCADCHLGDTTPQRLGCAQCHADPVATPFVIDDVHTGIPAYVADSSPTCLSCHPQAINPGTLDHSPFFPIVEPNSHSVVTCKECHASQANRSQLSCATCHEQAETATQHSLVAGYTHDSPACLTCHPQGQAQGAINHAQFFPIEQGSTHGQFTCADCHQNPADVTEVGCATCHTGDHDAAPMANVHGAVPGYTHDSPACLTCHPQGEAIGLAGVDHAPFFPIEDPAVHATIGCAECHVDNNDLTVNGCFECHSSGVTNITGVHSAVRDVDGNTRTTGCKSCHAEAQVDRRNQHSPFVITSGPHGEQRCLDCHANELGVGQTSPAFRADKPWATDFDQVTCIGCHEHDNEPNNHQGEQGFANTSPDCIRCHPQGQN
jgi:hypothetical protein